MPPSKLSLVVHTIGPINPTQVMTGLLVDEWVEVVPNTHETTALAFQFDMPDSCAPQSVLIAVPPVPGQDWTTETLRRVLMETLDLAKLRAVDTEVAGRRRAAPARPLPRVQHRGPRRVHRLRRAHDDLTGIMTIMTAADCSSRHHLRRPGDACPTVNRTFQVAGNISFGIVHPANWSLDQQERQRAVRAGRAELSAATFTARHTNWRCTGTVSPATPWGSMVQLTINAQRARSGSSGRRASPTSRRLERLDHVHGAAVPADHTDHRSRARSRRRSSAAQMPVSFAFTGSATSPQAPIQVVQYKVEGGQFANAVNVSGNWSQFRITLPLPPTTPGQPTTRSPIRAIDTFGTTGEISQPVAVQPQPPIVVPPGSKTTFSGAPTTSSITSWTRLEPQCTECRHRHQLQRARVRSAVDADAPVADGRVSGARMRARRSRRACARPTRTLCRRFSGELPKPTGAAPAPIAAQAYDPTAHAAGGARRAPPHARGRRDRRAHADVRRRVRAALPADAGAADAVEELSSRRSSPGSRFSRSRTSAPRSWTMRLRGTCSRWSGERRTGGSLPPLLRTVGRGATRRSIRP